MPPVVRSVSLKNSDPNNSRLCSRSSSPERGLSMKLSPCLLPLEDVPILLDSIWTERLCFSLRAPRRKRPSCGNPTNVRLFHTRKQISEWAFCLMNFAYQRSIYSSIKIINNVVGFFATNCANPTQIDKQCLCLFGFRWRPE